MIGWIMKNPPTRNIKLKTKASIGDKNVTRSGIVEKNPRLVSPPLIVCLDGSLAPLPAFLSNERCSISFHCSSSLGDRGRTTLNTTKLSNF